MQSFSGEMDQFYFTLKGKHRGPALAPATGICGSERHIIKYIFLFIFFFKSLSP